MKHFLMLLLIPIMVLILQINIQASCAGTLYTTAPIGYGTPPCWFTVTYCLYFDSLTGLWVITFDHIEAPDDCVDLYLNDPYFQATVQDQIMADAAAHIDTGIPPCPDHVQRTQYASGPCISVQNRVISNGTGGYTNVRTYTCCPDGGCLKVIDLCWDYSTNPRTLHQTVISSTTTGGLNCSPWEQIVFPSDDHDWVTPCFEIGCY